jgi:hypothetical protein
MGHSERPITLRFEGDQGAWSAEQEEAVGRGDVGQNGRREQLLSDDERREFLEVFRERDEYRKALERIFAYDGEMRGTAARNIARKALGWPVRF